MKIKTLRKKSTKEFIEISMISGRNLMYISDLPKPLSDNANFETLIMHYSKFYPDIDLNDIELVEFELVEILK